MAVGGAVALVVVAVLAKVVSVVSHPQDAWLGGFMA